MSGQYGWGIGFEIRGLRSSDFKAKLRGRIKATCAAPLLKNGVEVSGVRVRVYLLGSLVEVTPRPEIKQH